MTSTTREPIPNRDELVALRLLDPAAADSAHREALLRFLLTRGATIDDLRRSRDVGDLLGAPVDQMVRPGPRMTRRELSWRTAIDDDLLVRLRQVSGLSDPGRDVPHYTEADVLAVRAFERLALLFGEAVALQLMRITGTALSQIAEAAVEAYMVNLAAPLRALGPGSSGATTDDLAVARAFAEVVAALPDISRSIDTQLRHHFEAAVHQHAVEHRGATADDVVTLTVGFAAVGEAASWARTLPAERQAAATAAFSTFANDVVVAHGGRIVKLIGDELMFVSVDAAAACAIALALLDECSARDDVLELRSGLATGEVVVCAGDCHGRVVNQASRIAQQAAPGSVLVTSEVAWAAGRGGRGLTFRSCGAQQLRGFDDAVELLEVEHHVELRQSA